jgi:2-iminobutanoate/2-iminopropanoate deaminase
MQLQTIDKKPGHYTPSVTHNGLVYVSGVLPIVQPNYMPIAFVDQVQVVFQNLSSILEQAGSNKQNLIQVRVYITHMQLWDEFDAAYAKYLGPHKPARAVVPVSALHYGAMIELEAMAKL